jgi:hypothetical protein
MSVPCFCVLLQVDMYSNESTGCQAATDQTDVHECHTRVEPMCTSYYCHLAQGPSSQFTPCVAQSQCRDTKLVLPSFLFARCNVDSHS